MKNRDSRQKFFRRGPIVLGVALAMAVGFTSGVWTAAVAGTAYYVDAADGSDNAAGTAPEQAWQSLEPVNALELAPGDKVLLKAGREFSGPLAPRGSGAAGEPIVLGSYGEGPSPVVAGRGEMENTVRLHNQQHWTIRDLTLTNTDGGSFYDDAGRAIRRALYITAADVGEVASIHLKNLEIRDVRGMYRFKGHQTNGGIICRVLGDRQPTRFVDLRIADCLFRTKTIERYPVVVTSSWKKDPACEVLWKDNTLDYSDRPHIVIPAHQWPRGKVYYYDPEANEVFALDKHAPPVSPLTGRVGCEDIFSEMAARLRHTWDFFEATRVEDGKWLFAKSPGGKVHGPGDKHPFLAGWPLAYYAEMRALGFTPPWLDPADADMREQEDAMLRKWIADLVEIGVQRDESFTVRNRLFMNEKKWPAPRTDKAILSNLSRWGEPPVLETREKALEFFNNLPWKNNPYRACNFIGKALHRHRRLRVADGKDPDDDIYHLVKDLINSKFQPDKGYWGGQKANHTTRTSGNMKIFTTYAALDWEIPAPKKIIDFHLSGASDEKGFHGGGCSAFNKMVPLTVIRGKYPELQDYRGEEIDRYTAKTFMTFLSNWNEKTSFYGKTWLGKGNHAVVLYMAHLLLDQPYMRSSIIYNWRENPIITRTEDGSIEVNSVIYRREGYPFAGGG